MIQCRMLVLANPTNAAPVEMTGEEHDPVLPPRTAPLMAYALTIPNCTAPLLPTPYSPTPLPVLLKMLARRVTVSLLHCYYSLTAKGKGWWQCGRGSRKIVPLNPPGFTWPLLLPPS